MSTFEDQNPDASNTKTAFSQKIKGFWLKYEEKFVLAGGLILIAVIAFEAGFLFGEKNRKEPVVVDKIIRSADLADIGAARAPNEEPPKNQPATANIAVPDAKDCPFVASKNSNKYHLAACQLAQKIKAENKVCFSSTDEAQKRGFQGAKCCIK